MRKTGSRIEFFFSQIFVSLESSLGKFQFSFFVSNNTKNCQLGHSFNSKLLMIFYDLQEKTELIKEIIGFIELSEGDSDT